MKQALKALFVAAIVLGALVIPSTASAGHQLDSYCSPTGDYCTGVFGSRGSVSTILRTFSFRGDYELCLRAPRESFDCRTFTLRRKAHGIYEGRVGLAEQFGPLRQGRYAVRWRSGGYAIGPTLHFVR